MGSITKKFVVPSNLGKNVRPYLKSNQGKKGWVVAQMVEHLVSKHEALNSNPNTNKTKQKKKIKEPVKLKQGPSGSSSVLSARSSLVNQPPVLLVQL
jgi:hypothetical protein